MHERPNNVMYQDTVDQIDADEKKLCEVAKHPLGIIGLYFSITLGVIVALGLSFFMIPSVVEDTTQAFAIAGLVSLVIVILSALISVLASVVYRQNRLIVTDRNITQILQTSIFHRKVSQLNLVNVEDVTSEQNGLFSTMFGYGVLKIETAGEQANFNFTYCPRPGYYAKVILNAREKILGQQDGDATVSARPGSTM